MPQTCKHCNDPIHKVLGSWFHLHGRENCMAKTKAEPKKESTNAKGEE